MSDASRSASPANNHSPDSRASNGRDEVKRSSRNGSHHSPSNRNRDDSDRSKSRSPTVKKKPSSTKLRKSDRSVSRSPDLKKKSRKKSRSYRSRSLTKSHTRSRSRRSSRSRSHSRSRSGSFDEGYRVHVSDLPSGCSKTRLEETFEKYGKLDEVWLARNPPCFAFVVYKNRKDGEKAVREMDGQYLFGVRIRVSWARPRTRGARPGVSRRARDLNLRCYQCGEVGHFSRDCKEVWHQKRGYYRGRASRSVSRSRSPSRGDRRSRRSRSRSFERGSRYRR